MPQAHNRGILPPYCIISSHNAVGFQEAESFQSANQKQWNPKIFQAGGNKNGSS